MEGMPHVKSYQYRMKHDAAFRNRVGKFYKSAGPGRNMYSVADWDTYIALLAKGMKPNEIGRLPGHPTYGSFADKCRRDPAFKARVSVFSQQWKRGGRAAGSKNRASRVCCVLIAKQAEKFLRQVIGGNPPPVQLKRIVEAAIEATEAVRKRQIESRREKARVGLFRRRELWPSIARIVPSSLPDDARQDIIQAMCADVLEGTLTLLRPEEKVKAYIKSYWRQNPSKYGPLSLDAIVHQDGHSSLGDSVSVGLWD
jgi:hypothetical protein